MRLTKYLRLILYGTCIAAPGILSVAGPAGDGGDNRLPDTSQRHGDAVASSTKAVVDVAREPLFEHATGTRPIAERKRVIVTAYNSVTWQTDATPCIAADGTDICEAQKRGEESCAAYLPFGTKIYIPDFGICTVHDRLAKKYQNRVDIYFGGVEKVQAARIWGKRTLEVTIFE